MRACRFAGKGSSERGIAPKERLVKGLKTQDSLQPYGTKSKAWRQREVNKRGISTAMAAGIIVVVLVVAAIAVYYVTRPPAAPTAKIGLVLATGGLGDKSFNDIAYAGVQRAEKDLGIKFDYVQPTAIAQYEGYQRDFAKSGNYTLIVCIGFDQADALTKIATEYPKQNFTIVDMVVDKPNVASLLFKANEGSYLVGVAAGMKTKTGKVGFVGGMDIPLIRDFFEGYEAGAKWANSTVEVVSPVFVGGWADPTKGKELALGLEDLGVDAIFVAAGKSGLGALEAAHDRSILGLGVDACQCYLYPEIKASMTKRVDNAVFEMIEAAVEKKFQGGIKNGGLKEQWVGCCRLPDEENFWETKFAFTHPTLEAEVIDKIVEAKDKIVAGQITVPSGYD
jgi:basic membrane protein A